MLISDNSFSENTISALLKEQGVLPGSEIYAHTKGDINTELHQYITGLGQYACEYGYRVERHYYEYLLICSISQGTLYLEYEGHVYVAKEGEVLFFDCQKPQVYWAGKSGVSFLWIHFDGTLARKIWNELYSIYGVRFNNKNCKQVNEIMSFIFSSFRNDQVPPRHVLSSKLYDMMCRLYSADFDDNLASTDQVTLLAIEYMKLCMAKKISISDIADSAHMSKYHFSRIFKANTGYSPYDYLLNLRLDLAKHLLTTTKKTIYEISTAIGYNTEMGFIMTFSEKVGISPGKYRKFHY